MNAQTEQVMRQWTLAQPVVSSFLTGLVRAFSTRDDILQDVAVAVLESASRYDPSRPFIGWALGIARNKVRHHYRQHLREPLVFDDELTGQLAVAFERVAERRPQPLDHLQDCLRRLDGRGRMICGLRYTEGLKPAAIAAQLGMRPNSVAKALQRIRERLRECIEAKAALPEAQP